MNSFCKTSLYRWMAIVAVVYLLVMQSGTLAATPYQISWDLQFGTNLADSATQVAVDQLGNAYVSGNSSGKISGAAPNLGPGFLAKYDSSGQQVWARQDSSALGAGYETLVATGVATDGLGNVYQSGYYNNAPFGQCCDQNPYVSKYDGGGSLLWTKTFASPSSQETAFISADALGNVFLGSSRWMYPGGMIGGIQDGFITKLDGSGNVAWQKKFGNSGGDWPTAVSADGLGNVYVSGYQDQSDDGQSFNQAFVTKFDGSGILVWSQSFGGQFSGEDAFSVHADGLGNAYIAGTTGSDLLTPGSTFNPPRPYVAKYDEAGQRIWATLLPGNVSPLSIRSVTSDASGLVHIAGKLADGSTIIEALLPNGVSQGRYSIAAAGLASFNSIDSNGQYLYAVGTTSSPLLGSHLGGSDAMIVRLNVIPEPGSWMLALIAAVGCCGRTSIRRQMPSRLGRCQSSPDE